MPEQKVSLPLDLDTLNIEQVHALAIVNMELDQTAMLRRLHNISITSVQSQIDETKVVFTVAGTMDGRTDVATGVSSLAGLTGFDYANAIKAAETSAKRRLTTSLVGYGFQASKEEKPASQAPVAEPTQPDNPPVNNAPAEVVADTRVETTPISNVPVVSEELLSRLHQEAQDLAAPTPEPQAAPAITPIAAAPQPSIFDDEPALPQVDMTPSVPFTVSTTPAAPVVSTGQIEQPVQDIVVPVDVSGRPTLVQYRGYTQRCTNLVNALRKVSKDAQSSLLPYLKKTFGVSILSAETTLVLQWEETLGALESVTPADAFKLIKGGK